MADSTATADWRGRLLRALGQPLAAAASAPGERRDAAVTGGPARRAAVLIPVVGAVEPFIYLTRRGDDLPHHAGQISFPGGSVETRDAGVQAAALRETHEEIGLAPAAVAVLGALPVYRTVTGFIITPLVGWVDPGARVAADGVEVAEIFGVPLAYALDPRRFRQQILYRGGGRYRVYSIDYESRHIWGATAGILYALLERLAAVEKRALEPPARLCPRTLD